MASNRHLGRIIVLQSLYEFGFRKACGEKNVVVSKIVDRNISRYNTSFDDRDFIIKLAEGIEKSADELDAKIQPLASDWPLDQIARIDHIVLRIGAYELMYHSEIPPKVVINESVELAKGYGGENSSKFINGVLGSLLREINPDLAKQLDKTDHKVEAKKKKS
jgi:N utilization substance protein B